MSNRKGIPENCAIPQIWCGKSAKLPKGYYKSGTSYECLRKGIGAGIHKEQKKHLSYNSLLNIKYIGPVYEDKFKEHNIKTIDQLIDKINSVSQIQKEKLLKTILRNDLDILDKRAYNSVIVFLYKKHLKNLPECSKIKI